MTQEQPKQEIRLKYPSHFHPHGVENTKENPYRIWVCDECEKVFADEEIRLDEAQGKGLHICKSKFFKKETRCESHLESYLPEQP